jgi:hypothetical protein
MSFDPSLRQLLLMGAGFGGPIDPWVFDGASWTRVPVPSDLDSSLGSAMAYDAARQRIVLTWGSQLSCNQTFEWDGTTWSTATASNPFCVSEQAMAYDAARQRTVLFGGFNGSAGTSGTFEWDGERWLRRTPSIRPLARHGHAMAYDTARRETVLFGGMPSPSGLPLGDTWVWDGESWAERNPATSPPLRSYASMAYDEARQRVVLFGGSGFTGTLSDTWEWDGSTWTQRVTATRPPSRWLAALAYDPIRKRMVLWGGRDVSSQRYADTWEWDGTDWAQLVLSTNPPAEFGDPALAYDAARERMVLFRSAVTSAQTWVLGNTIAAADHEYGTGCAGGAYAPVLSPFGRAVLGNASFALDVYRAPPSAPLAYILAAELGGTPLGPCTLLVDPAQALIAPGAANATGFASLPLAVPKLASLLGARFFAQAAAIDAAAPLGIALTAGVAVRCGE